MPPKRKPKKKPKKRTLRPANIGLGGHSFSQQSFRESERFNLSHGLGTGTLSAGLPSNTATPSVSEFIRQQRIQRVRDRFPELNLPIISEEPPLGGIAPERFRMRRPTRIRGRVRPELDEEADRVEGTLLADSQRSAEPSPRTEAAADPEELAEFQRQSREIQRENIALRQEIEDEQERITEIQERMELQPSPQETEPEISQGLNVDFTDMRPAGAYRMEYDDTERQGDDDDFSSEYTSLPRAQYQAFEPPQEVEVRYDDDISAVTPSVPTDSQADDEFSSSEPSGFKSSVSSRQARAVPPRGAYDYDPESGALMTFQPEPRTMRRVPIEIESGSSGGTVSTLSSATPTLPLDEQMSLIRAARESVGDESTLDRSFQIEDRPFFAAPTRGDVGQRYYEKTQGAATAPKPQTFTKTDVSRFNSTEFKEFARQRGIEINPNTGYRSGTTQRAAVVSQLFSGKKRGDTIR
tara:strand:- start:404 stop:1804 length:1401 start_codon:yes stop_codon:yes gene_type:complete